MEVPHFKLPTNVEVFLSFDAKLCYNHFVQTPVFFPKQMKNNKLTWLILCVFVLLVSISATAQTAKLLKKTTFKNEKIEFGVGGTVTILGSPEGSISIEGWNKNEVEVVAEIEVQAENEADLAIMSQVNGFVIDASMSNLRILSVGMHDKDYMKKVAKKFPKRLYAMPWRIDYKIKVPNMSDLGITSGKGDIKLSKVEGSIQIKAPEANADLQLIGGTIDATFGNANVNVEILNRSWRGRHLNIQVANGTLNVKLPNNLNSDINAKVLRNGQIENLVETLKPRDRVKFTDKEIIAKAGNGGVLFTFAIGDGNMKIFQ
jgi:hypothetical protein